MSYRIIFAVWFWLLVFINPLFSNNQSVEYSELMERYQKLKSNYNNCDLISFGSTDSGEPLHLFLMNSSGEFYPEAIHKKTVLLIQNGIHAGEPCGIDASIEWAETLLKTNQVPENVVIGIIPVYNIGGMKNRGCCSRANQNGPEFHGFRGNAKNLDLNRDYIKCDSRNTEAFYRLFHWLKPEIFVDTHTSNGADYQYTMTLLSTRKERLDAHLSNFLINKIEPYLYQKFDSLSPYVNVFGTTPNDGIKSFNDKIRFSTGYASLFNCIGFTTEAHMWKPFNERKKATIKFLEIMKNFMDSNYLEIIKNKKVADSERSMGFESVNLKIDTTKYDFIEFYSFKPEYRYSDILGRKQLYYNRSKKETIEIKYFNYYSKTDQIQVPKYYLVSGAWSRVIECLQLNNVKMIPISTDTNVFGVGTYIENFSSVSSPYEGHYLHKEVQTTDSLITMDFHKGDFLIPVNQKGWRYILNTLETNGEDSFFAWNFFDEITQQKEWYSSYIFEPYASEMLENDEELRLRYEAKLETDSSFKSGDYRLYWLYTQSPFYEPVHNRIPILKVYE
ncbi:MAG: M14 family zinc carboxypeptidase [Salibacteraceae bacterium]